VNSQSPYSDDDDDDANTSRSDSSPPAVEDYEQPLQKPSRAQSAPAYSFSHNSQQSKTGEEPLKHQIEPVSFGGHVQQQQQNQQPAQAKNGEQMLIEKDGVFTLMTKEEYTAMEKRREEEERRNQSKLNDCRTT
jgi:hypothetical protein